MASTPDRWAAGNSYEDFMGRWSRLMAPKFVSWLGVPANARWLDVGCGTGAMTSAICANASPASVLGCDPAEPLIRYARRRSEDDRASFVTAGAGSLPADGSAYESSTSLFALNFFPDPDAAVREMQGLTASGGSVSACVWDYAGGMEFLRTFWDAAVEADPSATHLDEGRRFPICSPDRLTELFLGSGLLDVDCEALEVDTEFSSFEDYWSPFLGRTGPAPSYVDSLEPARRDALAEVLERTLPRNPSGAICLVARAWAVKGSVA